MGSPGLEHPLIPAGKTPVSDSGGNKSGNNGAGLGTPTPPAHPPAKPTDPELATVAAAWPTLPAAVRTGIVALVKAAASDGEGR